MNELDKNTIALAGEFAVLSQLALHGYDANMTRGHTKNFDIFPRFSSEDQENVQT